MKFYSVAKKAPVEVANSNITVRVAKNGRYQAVANVNGAKLYRFVNEETATKLGAPASARRMSARKSTRKTRRSTRRRTGRKSTKKVRKSTKKARKSTRRSTRRRSTRRA